ncbi:probable dolichyl pyrophosphate Glc1Man9GlcNAc2 alpha-1,3-glucosyltransferase [Galendromus occidentalis]|uniref:Alpha-1,3-glucosyltransferase n=1 Tax=Galendromus occidentalis TaxID=34638 RepID=A0AAJ7L6D0_9ACAR|nr:probable dolichyl pyrophosphate Glc1Man9GlcNAc2 alpha-1,3-glucosyltransferase [Galendromus occidentalis]
MSKNRDVFTIIGLATCVKILLVWTYRSTDFEVHRNWLAITHSLPLKEWYRERTSRWTLDYPPLFAWFEWFLSQIAARVDPKMLNVENLEYASEETILFQRFSVMCSDAVLFYAAYVWHGICFEQTQRLPRLFKPLVLVGLILNPGLLIVDHIHFQYNGILMGIMLLSMARIYQGHVLWGTLWFSILLNMKHIYLYIAPPFFIYLLRTYVLSEKNVRLQAIRLSQLGLIVAGVFSISFGPFIYHGQIRQVLSRLFPVRRGLLHSYWAPNIWALYGFCDEILRWFARKLGFGVPAQTITKGLVQEAKFAVLPNVPSWLTIVAALVLMTPSLYKLFRKPCREAFLHSVVYCGCVSFLVGFHVHEKAILIPLLGLLPLAVRRPELSGLFVAFSATGHFSLFPLLPNEQERFLKTALVLLYAFYIHKALSALRGRPALARLSKIYLLGLAPLFLYTEIISKVMPSRYEFLPLMGTSVYCAIGILHCFIPFSFAQDYTKLSERFKRQ